MGYLGEQMKKKLKLNKLDIIQNAAMRIITGRMRTNCINSLKAEIIPCSKVSLDTRRKWLPLKYINKCLEDNRKIKNVQFCNTNFKIVGVMQKFQNH